MNNKISISIFISGVIIASAIIYSGEETGKEIWAPLYAKIDPEFAAKESVRALMYDGKSAQFRSIKTSELKYICGEVNGKNRMGAYVGFRKFSYHPDTQDTVLIPEGDKDWEDLYKITCS